MDPAADDDDSRSTELDTLEAIYPELIRISASSNRGGADGVADGVAAEVLDLIFELELPVEAASPVTVTFPAASSSAPPPLPQQLQPYNTEANRATAAEAVNGAGFLAEDSLQVSHLPPLSLRISLPPGYPKSVPLQISVSTTPPWLPEEIVNRLQEEGPRLWEESGRDIVAFAYIDHVQREAADVFGAITDAGVLQVHPDHKLTVLDYDIKAKKAAFERETFECGICLDPKKGSKCHKMMDCGHIFCTQCLQDFYNDAILEGSISTVRCLAPNCAKERKAALAAKSTRSARKVNTFISPSELLQIGLAEETVKRYVALKYKTELESDKNTIYCPRQWCTGAARSKKHKKPAGPLAFVEMSDDESDQDDGSDHSDDEHNGETGNKSSEKKQHIKFNPADLLAVCEDCGFAFCSKCEQSWHGEFFRCTMKRKNGELTEEEKASLEYLKLHTSPCPTCNAPAQKTHGCNHMICSRCETHFCYLCSSWLDPANPYKHYNQQENGKVTSCYMRLWELEGGDGNDVGLGFGGGRAPGAAAPAPEAQADELDELIIIDMDDEVDGNNNDDPAEGAIHIAQPPANPLRQQPVAVAREAPLVLRLIDNGPRGRGRGGHLAAGNRDQAAPEPALPIAHERNPVPRGAARGAVRGAVRGAARGDVHRRGGGRGAFRGQGARGGRARGGEGGRGRGADNHPRVANRLNPEGHGPPDFQNRPARANANANADVLGPAQEAWVRRFVQMALIDAEDQVDGDSDDDGEDWRIR